MELVYLWVEEYKNIKNQGFNFSPRFDCKFHDKYKKDDNGKKELEINCELEIKPKEYTSIFSDNINITAIVGENGSGKSNLFNFIFDELKYTDIDIKQRPPTLFVYFCKEKEKIYIHTKPINKIKITNKTNFIDYKTHKKRKNGLIRLEDANFEDDLKKCFYYNYNNSLEIDQSKNKQYEYNDSHIVHYEINKSNNIINLDIESEKITRYMLDLIIDKRLKNFNLDNNFFIPTTLWIESDMCDSIIDDDFNVKYFEFKNDNDKKAEELILFENIIHLKEFLEKVTAKSFLTSIEPLKELFKNQDIFDVDVFEVKNDIMNTYWGNKINEKIASIKDEIVKDAKKGNDHYLKEINEFEKIIDMFIYYKRFILLIDNKDKIHEHNYRIKFQKDDIEFLKNLPSYFKFDFAEKDDKHFSEISSGEQNLLKLLFSIENIITSQKNTHVFNIFLDEIEVTFHPNWQKKIINWIIEFFNPFNKKINFFIASHSPFILSDIPKENVIFLEDGKQIHPFKKNEQTFGANIHTLLSDSFFMKDGLMGEFAKGKIEEIKKFYDENKNIRSDNTNFQTIKDDYKSKIKSFRHIQSIIGEPFLQTVIKNYLDELELILSDDHTLIDNEINQLELKIEKLKSLKNG